MIIFFYGYLNNFPTNFRVGKKSGIFRESGKSREIGKSGKYFMICYKFQFNELYYTKIIL